jgi:ATP-dependent exoDNAse (exonuclease V) alpha subunit
MSIYHLTTKHVTRSRGRSATAAAAYRSGEKIFDHTSGETFDYTRKRGVEHTEIVLSSEAAKRDINWARDREALWNAAEAAEKRKDSRVAREYEVGVPHELTKAQRIALVRAYASDLANRYGVAVDFALHKPHRHGDERNYHAHILATTRKVEAQGLGAKASIEWSDTHRAKEGLESGADELLYLRKHWEDRANEHLLAAGHEARIDSRSLKDQGIEREPTQHRGPAITGILERGERSIVADRWGQEANERLRVAKEMGELERERTRVQEQWIDLSKDLASTLRERERFKTKSLSIDEMRAKSRENWQAYRDNLKDNPEKAQGRGKDHGLEAGDDDKPSKGKGHSRDGPDDDFGL